MIANMLVLYDRIDNLLKEKNITKKIFCEDMEISRSTLTNWQEKLPNSKKLEEVADYLDASTDYLLGRIGERNIGSPSRNISLGSMSLIDYIVCKDYSDYKAKLLLQILKDIENATNTTSE